MSVNFTPMNPQYSTYRITHNNPQAESDKGWGEAGNACKDLILYKGKGRAMAYKSVTKPPAGNQSKNPVPVIDRRS